ncbi:hypothetical protein M513_09418 [Trichuris suis]|uniref:Reverse transcriptase domain-containing protein n=1 Tax=Trichuris suis TaxID=68888 RepID=A0A085LXM5_9BILA|nr:hypothetical protein M513_09418 [Trichuris suis]
MCSCNEIGPNVTDILSFVSIRKRILVMVKAAEVLARPLRQTVDRFSDIGGGTTAQNLVNNTRLILRRPLTGSRASAVKNSKEFCAEIKSLRSDPSDILVSYDVKDLFTSIPMDAMLDALEKLLDMDSTLAQRTSLKTFHVNKLVSFCMKEANYFLFHELFYMQKGGAPMGPFYRPF